MSTTTPTPFIESPEHQDIILALKKHSCLDRISSHPNLSGNCPGIWDGILCWDQTPANQLSVQRCPGYIAGFQQHANASKQCTANATWFSHEVHARQWTNFSQCFSGPEATVLVHFSARGNVTLIQDYMPALKIISQVGYGVSLVSLVIAFVIMASIKISLFQEAALPSQHAPHAPVRVLHHASLHGAAEELAVRHGRRALVRHRHQERRLVLQRAGGELGVQADHVAVAVLHDGQLLVDPHGGAVPAQPHLPGTVLRHELHHAVRGARVGLAGAVRHTVGRLPSDAGEHFMLDRQRQHHPVPPHQGAHHSVHSPQLLAVPQHREGPPAEAAILRLRDHQDLQALGQVHAGAGAAVRGALHDVPGAVLQHGHRRKRGAGLALLRPAVRLLPGLLCGGAVLLHERRGANGAVQGVQLSALVGA